MELKGNIFSLMFFFFYFCWIRKAVHARKQTEIYLNLSHNFKGQHSEIYWTEIYISTLSVVSAIFWYSVILLVFSISSLNAFSYVSGTNNNRISETIWRVASCYMASIIIIIFIIIQFSFSEEGWVQWLSNLSVSYFHGESVFIYM